VQLQIGLLELQLQLPMAKVLGKPTTGPHRTSFAYMSLWQDEYLFCTLHVQLAAFIPESSQKLCPAICYLCK